MDFTFGGKYRLEEELAIGGCGSSPSLFFFCLLWKADRTYRDCFLRSAQSGRERSGDQARTGSGKATESAQTRVSDLQDAHGWPRRAMDDMVWQAGRL